MYEKHVYYLQHPVKQILYARIYDAAFHSFIFNFEALICD